MPTYQYRCTACGNDLEAVQGFSDAALTECPTCSGRLRKVFGSIGVVFKGTGFYKTDSRSTTSGATKERAKDSDAASKDTSAASTSGSASSNAGGSDSSSSGGSTSSSGSTSSTSSTSSSGSKTTAGSTSTAAA